MPSLQMYIEVNIAGEAAKHDVAPDEAVMLACEVAKLPNLKMCRLMRVTKADAGETELREAFGRMRALLTELNAAGAAADALSMGMSGGMKIIIACGTVHVRIGSAIFDRRDCSE